MSSLVEHLPSPASTPPPPVCTQPKEQQRIAPYALSALAILTVAATIVTASCTEDKEIVNMTATFDISKARERFPALQQDQVFLDNAGGSQALDGVIDS